MLDRYWYSSSFSWITFFLTPFSWIFYCIVTVRYFLYRKIKKNISFPVPIIVVGNMTVGGTGKTPLVIWLAQWLLSNGLSPGIVSRGVGGKIKNVPRWVEVYSDPREVGDEAILLRRRTQVPVVIGKDRVLAVKTLLSKTQCNIIISDDGLQHYRLPRDIEIVVMDGLRGWGNKKLLPAGPLRESLRRLQSVDFVVTQGSPEKNKMTMQLVGEQCIALKNENQEKNILDFKSQRVHAVAGVGNPTRFFMALRNAGIEIIEHIFPDHYAYQKKDIYFEDHFPVIMTEKDAVKCVAFSDERHWYYRVDARLSREFEVAVLKKLIFFNRLTNLP